MNTLLKLVAGVALTGALVILGMAWGRYVAPGTSVDINQAVTGIVLAGALITWPAIGLLHTRR